MLRYRKLRDANIPASAVKEIDDLLNALTNVPLDRGRGRDVVVPDWLSSAIDAGKSEALTHLAGLHLGTDQNGEGLAKALPLLREAADKGYAPAQTQLGIISLFGLGCDAAPDEAVGWLRLAADQGSRGAQSLLGMMFATGTGIQQDLSEARRLLTLAEQQGDSTARACLNSGTALEMLPQLSAFFLGMWRVLVSVISDLRDNAREVAIWREVTTLADAGNADACLVLATHAYSTKDCAEVLRWCRSAAMIGNELATLILGFLSFANSNDTEETYAASELLDAAVKKGSVPAQVLLGMMHATGRGARRDLTKANYLLDLAAEGMDASTKLGSLLEDPDKRFMLETIIHLLSKILAEKLSDEPGSNVVEGSSIAREALRFAEQGDRYAQFFVGTAFLGGEDLEKNEAMAVQWLRRAAEQGVIQAQYHLGICLDTGQGVDRDRAEAAHWFRLAAKQGLRNAQLAIAYAYLNGNGVGKDVPEALSWFRLAAELGDTRAQYQLGSTLQLYGEGSRPDLVEGAYWLRQAAEQGNADAQFETGLCFLLGDGVEEDSKTALHWFLKAAAQGSQEAKEILHKAASSDPVAQDVEPDRAPPD